MEDQVSGKSDTRPELGPVAVGDELIVISPSHRRNVPERIHLVTVIRAARVWIEVVDTEDLDKYREHGYGRTWRLRMDTQTDGGKVGYPTRFRTLEQHAWELRNQAAAEYLREIGLNQIWRSPRWKNDQVTLANLLREHDGLEKL